MDFYTLFGMYHWLVVIELEEKMPPVNFHNSVAEVKEWPYFSMKANKTDNWWVLMPHEE